jgi:hypothetical protein
MNNVPFDDDDGFVQAITKMKTVIATGRKVSKAYIGEYKNFLQWVKENKDDLGLDAQGPVFVNRTNVDRYFTTVCVNRNGNRNTANRIYQALQWFYSNVETPTGDFVVKIRWLLSHLRNNR